jgi:predicted transcriptional regulator
MPAAPPVSTLTRSNSTVKDLFVYLYDLSSLELELLFLLVKNSNENSNNNKKSMTLEELGKKVKRDKSTVFKSLQKLVLLGIVNKDTKTINGGGYYHAYSAIDIDTFKVEVQKKVKELKDSLDRIVRKFEDDIETSITTFYDLA